MLTRQFLLAKGKKVPPLLGSVGQLSNGSTPLCGGSVPLKGSIKKAVEEAGQDEDPAASPPRSEASCRGALWNSPSPGRRPSRSSSAPRSKSCNSSRRDRRYRSPSPGSSWSFSPPPMSPASPAVSPSGNTMWSANCRSNNATDAEDDCRSNASQRDASPAPIATETPAVETPAVETPAAEDGACENRSAGGGRESPVDVSTRQLFRPVHAAGARSQTASTRDTPPQPKRMPKRMPRPPLPTAPLSGASPASQQAPGQPPGVSIRPAFTVTAHTLLMEGQPAEELQELARKVLARHVVRLGNTTAGRSLEGVIRTMLRDAVQTAVRASGAEREAAKCVVETWKFLMDPTGLSEFRKDKESFSRAYAAHGCTPNGDKVVRSMLPANDLLSKAAGRASLPEPITVPNMPLQPNTRAVFPIGAIRFAHDAQSEVFGRNNLETGPGGARPARSILQLTIELIAGMTELKDVPHFRLCQHDSQWYCRNGNRRLAALRLARRFAPGRFEETQVQIVDPDPDFLVGIGGRLPKLTTYRNGMHCRGRWLRIKQTGERVCGEALPPHVAGEEDYGADLLSLLFPQSPGATTGSGPVPTPTRVSSTAGAKREPDSDVPLLHRSKVRRLASGQ